MMKHILPLLLALLTACASPQPPPPAVAAAPAALTTAAPALRGTNLNGADFGSALPGILGRDYTWPTPAEVDYFRAKGMNAFRIGFQWERLQPSARGAFATTYAAALDALVVYATSKSATVILNPQNFARYYGNVVGSANVPNDVFADLWRRLAQKYAGNALVVFGLVNEPNTMPTEQWVSAANAAIAAIRAAGAQNLISVPGNGWTGADSWSSNWYGTSNAVALLKIADANAVFEVHNYFDRDASGAGSECVSATVGSDRMKGVVAWARLNRKRVYVGEFGTPNTPTCQAAVKDFLTYLAASSDVVFGWTWWSAGPWWWEYPLTIEPKAGVDRPQMGWLQPFLSSGPCVP